MDKIDVALDIGNWYIKGIVVWKEDDNKTLLVKEIIKTKWMRKWRVLDVDEFANSIGKIINSFERKLGEGFVEEVSIWISHPNMIIKRIKEQKRILTNKIEEDDIKHLQKIINDFGWEPNYEIIFSMPVMWIINDEIKVSNPIDMEWQKLELVADVFMIPRNLYNNIYDVFENLWIEVKSILPNILVSSDIVLDIDSKDLWVCLIDIWTNQTTFVVYEEGIPIYYGVLPYWWEDVTKDISIGLQVDISDAERIKREYWIVEEWNDINDSTIDVKFVSEIIKARYEEIFEKINSFLIDLGRDWKLAWWVVFIWWGSKTKNIDKIAKDIFKLAVFFGKDKVVWLWDISSNLQFLNVIGVYYWKDKFLDKISSYNFSLPSISSYIDKIIQYIKKMF